MAVGQILRDFSGWTSAHGVPHIGSAQNLCLRIFWTVVFLLSTVMFSYQLYNLVTTYLAFGVTVSTALKFEERDFPVITICNLNPYKKSGVRSGSEMDIMLENFVLASTNPQKVDNGTWGFAGVEPVVFRGRALHALALIGADMSEEERAQATYTMNDIVQSCAYNTKACDMTKDFKLIQDKIYGACYQFNTESIYTSTRAGPLYGLRLLIKVNQSEYLETTRAAGVRVSVHGQNEEPFPDAFGFTAAPGFTTSFGIKFVTTERLGFPYGNCTAENATDMAFYYTSKYSIEGCFRSCIQDAILDKCRCSDPRFPVPRKRQACNVLNLECVADFYSNAGSGRRFNTVRDCPCPQPCEEAAYGVTVSTASWPSKVYTPPECDSKDSSWDDAKSCHNWYHDNTLFLEVFYERMNYQLLKENEAYGLVTLISDMGGQLGLWMGVSVISVVEFISLLVLLCVYCIARKSAPQPIEEDSDSEFSDEEDLLTETPAPPNDDLYDHGTEIDPPQVQG